MSLVRAEQAVSVAESPLCPADTLSSSLQGLPLLLQSTDQGSCCHCLGETCQLLGKAVRTKSFQGDEGTLHLVSIKKAS